MAANSVFVLENQTITVSHSGKQHAYHLAYALLQQKRLQGFYTSSYVTPAWLQRFFLATGNTFFTRRFRSGLAAPWVHSAWGYELNEFMVRKFQGKSAAVQNLVYRRDTRFDARMARILPGLPSAAFWGFQGSCHASLQASRNSGKVAICELATAHVVQARKILSEEARLLPEWADSIDNLYFPTEYEKRLEEEPFRADAVVAASRFTRQTLEDSGVDPGRIHVLPLGFEAGRIPASESHRDFENRPLRLLFAGTITQRKGIAYLLEAMKTGGFGSDVELHLVGGIQGSGRALERQKEWFQHLPAVSQYELFRLYGEFDALVLPTVFEGFGLVIVEAMAAGLPVITTPHSMGPDVVTQGENGWIVPIRDVKALQAAIGSLRALDNAAYARCRTAARQAALAFTWEAYARNLQALLPLLVPPA